MNPYNNILAQTGFGASSPAGAEARFHWLAGEAH